MSDFLTRLLDRSRGDVPPAIRPRLASAFEAGLAVAPGSAAPPSGEEPEITGRAAYGRMAVPRAHGEQAEAPPTLYRGPLVAVRPLPGESGETQRRPEAPAPAAPRAPPGGPQAEPEPIPLPLEPLAEASAATAVPERPRAPPRAIPIQPRVVRPEEQRHESPSSRAGADGNGNGEAAPIVRVSIGRIEVRAITEAPPPPPAVRKPAAPRLSLDEYLRERTRGER